MDQISLMSVLVWLLLGLGVVAIVLGVMIYIARRIDDGSQGIDEDAALPTESKRPPRGSKTSPLKLTPREYRGLHLADFHNDHRALRDFGELVTVAVLSGEGWKKLPSRLQGGQGIDLLLVRELKGAAGYEARAVEVKTNTAAHNHEAMSDERLADALGRLHDAGAFDAPTLEELLRGLWQGPPYFRKELWRHQLDSGETTIFELDETGNKMSAQRRSFAHVMDALFQTIKQFDRKADYVDRPVVEAPLEEVVHASARRMKRKHASSTFLQAYARAFSFRSKRPPERSRAK